MRNVLITVLIAGVLIAMLPPFFTHGACTAEFDAVGSELDRVRPELATLTRAEGYLTAHAITYGVLTAERCELSPPRDVEICPGGPVLLAAVPVKDRICRLYRDDRVRIQLGFNAALQLVRLQTDMHPCGILKSRILGIELDWAK